MYFFSIFCVEQRPHLEAIGRNPSQTGYRSVSRNREKKLFTDAAVSSGVIFKFTLPFTSLPSPDVLTSATTHNEFECFLELVFVLVRKTVFRRRTRTFLNRSSIPPCLNVFFAGYHRPARTCASLHARETHASLKKISFIFVASFCELVFRLSHLNE